MMIIDQASTADIPFLCELLNQLFSLESEFKPDYETQSRGLSSIIASPEIGCILVARHRQQVVGMLNILYTVSTALGGRVAIFEDMVVAESKRNLGIGTLLIEQAIQVARQNDCKRITLLTDRDNQVAQRFYRRLGFKVSTMIPMRLLVES